MTKSALFILYSFPPAGGPGVQRGLKFIKYLPEWGWRPIVLSTTPEAYPVLDPSLEADIPADTPIYRVRSYDIRALRPAFERVHLGKVLSGLNAALMLPDAALFWARAARPTLRQVIVKHKPRVLFSSSPPASAHILAQWAHQTFHLPWVADFRDPWTKNPLAPHLPGYKTINRRMEQRVLATAHKITTVSQPLVNALETTSHDKISDIAIIENGYDEDDVTRWPPPQTDKFTILYTGAFSRIRNPKAFVEAVDLLLETNRIPLEQFRVALAGKDIENFIPRRPPFEILGYLTHGELDRLRRDSDLLLLILTPAPQGRGHYSGKLFEYLASNRPILVVARPDNVAVQLIQKARAGTAVSHDPKAIAQAIEQHFRIWQARRFDHHPDWRVIQQFSRRHLTGRLVELFESLTTN
ncbi:MAG: glycosyltransferase family 4 protein [Chloroflexi bacterium]|nr:glycosyltransferase family 4 protein [Chloroflexota bacterium]